MDTYHRRILWCGNVVRQRKSKGVNEFKCNKCGSVMNLASTQLWIKDYCTVKNKPCRLYRISLKDS